MYNTMMMLSNKASITYTAYNQLMTVETNTVCTGVYNTPLCVTSCSHCICVERWCRQNQYFYKHTLCIENRSTLSYFHINLQICLPMPCQYKKPYSCHEQDTQVFLTTQPSSIRVQIPELKPHVPINIFFTTMNIGCEPLPTEVGIHYAYQVIGMNNDILTVNV